jgi:PKD-like domain/Secretion system C-terminal sorting domain
LKVADFAGVDTGLINSWTLTLNNEVPATLNYSWSSNPAGFSSSDPNPVVTPNASTTYTVAVYNTLSGCTGTASALVVVNDNPVVTFASMNDVCNNQSAIVLNQGIPSGGSYSGSGVISNSFYPPVAGTGSHSLTYNYVDNNGCSGSATQSINVNSVPATPAGILGTSLVCAGSQKVYTVASDPTATSYSWVVPSGVQILQGQGTNQVEIGFANNYSTGSLCVYAANACGSSAPECKSLVKQHGRFCPRRVPTSWGDRGEASADNDFVSADDLILTIQPNPTSENAVLVIEGTASGKGNLSIIDVLGKTVYSQDVTLASGSTTVPLKLMGYSKGIYMVNVKQGLSIINTRLVIE